MKKLNISITGILIFLFLSGMFLSSCTSSAPAYVPSSSASSSAGAGRQLPDWFSRPDDKYPSAQYVVGRGEGRTSEEAQTKAKGDLLQVFGMKLSDEQIIAESYEQTTRNNNSDWTETINSNRRLSASAEGILVGCEIKETAISGNTHYALAVMEKPKALNSYNDIIKRLSAAITDVINIPNINTIDGYARYKIAAELAKDVEACISVVRFVGGAGSIPAGLKSEREYLNEASNIISAIPVRVVLVRGAQFDTETRIQNAFAKAIGAVGFRTGTSTSPYVLEVSLALSEVELNNPNKFSRYEISAALLNSSTRQGVIPPYSINGREGHANYSEAEQRAVRAAETRINSEYKDLLEKSLAEL